MSIQLEITGMSCDGCVSTVEEALQSVPAVTSVAVDRERDFASVDGDVDPRKLVAVVEDAGYDAGVTGQ